MRRVVFAGGLLGALGMAALAQVGASFSLVDVGWRLLLVGLGLGLSTGPSQAAALSVVDQRLSGRASAMISMLRYVGGIAGTTILSVALGQSADSLTRHRIALWIFTAAFASSSLCALALRPLAGKPVPARGIGPRLPA